MDYINKQVFETDITRREVLGGVAAFGAGLLAPEVLVGESPRPTRQFFGPVESLSKEYDYSPRIEGALPRDLRGSLFRNGPGLFERDGHRKRCMLDGDGMIQAFDFSGGKVRYRNRFVRTKKYIAEERAGKYKYAGWTTNEPGGRWSNLGPNIDNQAGVSVWERAGNLFAFDEFNVPYVLEPGSLATKGRGLLGPGVTFSAHPKVDPQTGEWIHFGCEFGRNYSLHISIFDKANRLTFKRTETLDREYYMHDFFVTPNYLVFSLQPAIFSSTSFLLGAPLTDTLKWRPELGHKIMIFKRGDASAPPVTMDIEPHWMWHSLNAFEKNGEIFADLVAYDNPDHFIGPDPHFYAVMQGRVGDFKHPGTLRRMRLDLKAKKASLEVLDKSTPMEFPILNPALAGREHRFGYFACERGVSPFRLPNAVRRFDFKSGRSAEFFFGKDHYAGEPIFVPRKGAGPEAGFLLSLVYDDGARKSFLAVLDAQRLGAGPVAKVLLEHHTPISFHGCFVAGRG